MPIQWPGKWFVGESQLDYDEWGFDGTVWSEPDPNEPPEFQEAWLVAEHIKDPRDAKLIAASPLLLASLKSLFALAVMPGNFTEARRQQMLTEAREAIRRAEGQ